MIGGFHTLLAIVTRAEELAVDEEEAIKLAEASALVARHYNVEVAAKTTDWINLAIVAGSIYAPRIVAMRMRATENRQSAPRRAAPVSQPQPERATVIVSEAPEADIYFDAMGMPRAN